MKPENKIKVEINIGEKSIKCELPMSNIMQSKDSSKQIGDFVVFMIKTLSNNYGLKSL